MLVQWCQAFSGVQCRSAFQLTCSAVVPGSVLRYDMRVQCAAALSLSYRAVLPFLHTPSWCGA